ncbi:MAG: fibronectin type III domain-containing protein [Candidatus Thorarchaeota archaeon SMTZ1-45]
MKSKSTITLLIVSLMASSLLMVTTLPITNTPTPQGIETPRGTYSTSADLSLSPPNILVYTEFVDSRVGEEYENTMTAINNTYGTDYQHTNLTDYTNLDTQLSGKDILLIPEQENANITIMKTVGLAWASALHTFVDDGGVVILLDFGNASNPGLGLHIYNESSLMQFGPVLDKYPGGTITLLHRSVFGDALCRRIDYQPAPRGNIFAVATTDGTIAIDDYYTDDPIGVHKTIGRGHVVFLGFDLSDPDSNYEQIVGNAIRLPNHVVIDVSQNQEFDFEFPAQDYQAAAWVEDMLEAGFAVSRMDTFSPALFNASEVLICYIPYWTDDYSTSEITAIDAYVADGGSILIFSDWGDNGDEIRALANNFGYDWARNCLWDTDDAMRTFQPSQIAYTGDNLLTHPITYNVSRVEFYASDGFTTLPANAEKILVSDWDGTSAWRDPGQPGPAAEGITLMAVSRYGSGRVCVALDSNFVDGTADTDSAAPEDYYDSDNDIILMNTVHWLTGVETANEAPLLSGLTHTPPSPLEGEPVTVYVNAVDADGLDNITCNYRGNGGAWLSVPMSPEGGDLYSATIGNFTHHADEYYVRAFDNSVDKIESMTAIVYLHTINAFPSTPTLHDPGTSDDDGVFLLNWTASVDPDGYIDRYEIEMSDTSWFTVILGRWNSSIDEKVITVYNNDTYYFRVRAVDDYGTKGFWSFPQSINVVIVEDTVAPSISTPTHSPLAPKQGESVTVMANITDPHGIESVICWYSVNSGSWISVAMVNTIGDRYEANIGSFLVDDIVEYDIHAYDNSTNHNEGVSSTESFQIINQPPTAPNLLDPGTTISVSHVIVNWMAGSDHENAIDHYQLQVSLYYNFATTLGEWNTTSLNFNVTDLVSGTYYFRVRVFDDHDAASLWSNIESIEVILDSTTSTPPTTPTTPTPTTGGTPFDPDILNFILLIVTGGFVVIIIIIVASTVRQRSKRQYNF